MSSNPSKRQPNFSSGEIEKLLSYVNKYLDIVNSKDQKVEMQRRKKACWETIAARVNVIGGNKRTGEECRKKWCDVKSNVKAKTALVRKDKVATGGGPPTVSELTPLEQNAAAMMAPESISGVSGGYESMLNDSPVRRSSPVNDPPDLAAAKMAEDNLLNDSPVRHSSPVNDPPDLAAASAPKRVRECSRDMEGIYRCEQQRMQVEKERLTVEKERLAVERERLAIERARLAIETRNM